MTKSRRQEGARGARRFACGNAPARSAGGVLVAGALLEHQGLMVNFAVLAGGVTLVALVFVWLLDRFSRRELRAAAVTT